MRRQRSPRPPRASCPRPAEASGLRSETSSGPLSPRDRRTEGKDRRAEVSAGPGPAGHRSLRRASSRRPSGGSRRRSSPARHSGKARSSVRHRSALARPPARSRMGRVQLNEDRNPPQSSRLRRRPNPGQRPRGRRHPQPGAHRLRVGPKQPHGLLTVGRHRRLAPGCRRQAPSRRGSPRLLGRLRRPPSCLRCRDPRPIAAKRRSLRDQTSRHVLSREARIVEPRRGQVLRKAGRSRESPPRRRRLGRRPHGKKPRPRGRVNCRESRRTVWRRIEAREARRAASNAKRPRRVHRARGGHPRESVQGAGRESYGVERDTQGHEDPGRRGRVVRHGPRN